MLKIKAIFVLVKSQNLARINLIYPRLVPRYTYEIESANISKHFADESGVLIRFKCKGRIQIFASPCNNEIFATFIA